MGKTYKDKVSGETLYVSRDTSYTEYYKDKARKILHRVDGPAKEYGYGTGVWFQNGVRHRMNGPAIEWDNGSKEWWIDDESITGIVYGRYIGPTWLQEKLDSIKGI